MRLTSRGGRQKDKADEAEAVEPTVLQASEEDVLNLLAAGEVRTCELIPWGSNYTFLAALAVPDGPTFHAVYKPRRGEAPLWDFPDGTLYRREVAAYRLSRHLGWGLVPPTVVHDGPHGVGSIQLFVQPEEPAHYYALKGQADAELRAICLFDLISNNADRKPAHCFRGVDGRIWGIDHGLTFHSHPKLRTVIWDFVGEPIPDRLLEPLTDLCTERARSERLRAELGDLLDRKELEALFQRVERVLQRPRFPELGSYRNVPWGFV